MMCDKVGERKKHLSWGKPVKRTHGEMVVISVPGSELVLEVGKGKELV